MAKKLAAVPSGAEQPPAGVGHNGLTEEKYLLHKRAIIQANAKLEEARAARNSIRKLAKADGVELRKIDAAITMMEWSPDEVREHFSTELKYARWSRLLPGESFDLFNDDDDSIPAFAADELSWEKKGWAAGIKGAEAKTPNDCPGDRTEAWMKGWHAAQAKLASQLGTPANKAAA